MKHTWATDMPVPLERDEAQRLWLGGAATVKFQLSGYRRVYCRRCWAELDRYNLDGECVESDKGEKR